METNEELEELKKMRITYEKLKSCKWLFKYIEDKNIISVFNEMEFYIERYDEIETKRIRFNVLRNMKNISETEQKELNSLYEELKKIVNNILKIQNEYLNGRHECERRNQ